MSAEPRAPPNGSPGNLLDILLNAEGMTVEYLLPSFFRKLNDPETVQRMAKAMEKLPGFDRVIPQIWFRISPHHGKLA
jgi:hypothetical protein